MLNRTAVIILSATLALGAAACGSSAVSTGDLETEVANQLEAQVGVAPDSVSCPDALDSEVGANVRCTLTSGDDTVGLTVTVTSVEDDVATLDILVDDAPEG